MVRIVMILVDLSIDIFCTASEAPVLYLRLVEHYVDSSNAAAAESFYTASLSLIMRLILLLLASFNLTKMLVSKVNNAKDGASTLLRRTLIR